MLVETRIRIRRMLRSGLWLVLSMVLFMGCGATPQTGTDPLKEGMVLVWPEPPQEPRIRFVRTLAGEADLGRNRSFAEGLRHFISGEKPSISHLYQPRDIAVSDDGMRVYVSDYAQYLVFLFDLEHNTVTHIGKNKPFARPFGVALDAEENLYVVEQQAAQIRVVHRNGDTVRVIQHPSLIRPTDLAIDRDNGFLYVSDPSRKSSSDHSVKVFDLQGNFLRRLGKGKGDCEGCLFFPTFVEVGPNGNVYVSNTLNARVEVFDAEGEYLSRIGNRGTSFGMFDKPKGVAVDTFGNIYVADSGWSNVQIFNASGEVLLYFGGRGVYPGLLRNPAGICIDKNNRIYVADYLNYQVTVYELLNTTAGDSYAVSGSNGSKSQSPSQND